MTAQTGNERPAPALPEEDHTLDGLRKGINAVDEELVGLLNRRAALSLAVGRLKAGDADAPVFRPGREAELFRHVTAISDGPLPEAHLRAIYREILSSSRHLQRPQRVSFLGPEGTFSHMAGKKLLGSLASFHPQENLDDVFRAVESGDCDIAVVPLENSREGSVGKSIDLLLQYSDLFVRAETYLRIRHCLMSSGRDISAVTHIYSHPQPLAQCSVWLRNNLPRATLVPVESTAAAARMVAESKEAGSAAIAHASLADELGLHPLAQGIEDISGNYTRFLVLGRTPADRSGTDWLGKRAAPPDKSSLLFSVLDKPGSLATVLQCFADKGINIRKLESRPMQGEMDKYVFFADLSCDVHEEPFADALHQATGHCFFLRVLGSYPAAGLQP